MKKTLFFAVTLISLVSFSQKDYTRYYNSWRLGLNVGASWQTADVKSCYGYAYGITTEKGIAENSNHFFSLALRGRYLFANTYGMDYKRNYDIKGNDALNGKYNPAVNYLDTALKTGGYIYDNYKMNYHEGSLELQLNFNRLRQRTHVILNLWGGVGFTAFKTKMNLLDASGKMFDFSKIDSTGNASKALNNYNTLIDRKYESSAFGSNNGYNILFAPSAGLGLGYQFNPGFSMILEYKVTLPKGTNADLLDGKYGNNTDNIGGNNDYYNYFGLNFLITLRGKHHHSNYNSTTNQNQQTTVQTNTVNNINNNNTVVTNNNTNTQTTEIKPVINFILPSTQNEIATTNTYTFAAKVLNIANTNQLSAKYNGTYVSNYSFDAYNKILSFVAPLKSGTNVLELSATNSAGTDVKQGVVVSQSLVIAPPTQTLVSQRARPTVVITNPNVASASSQNQNFNLTAIVKNVTNSNAIMVLVNNNQVANFSYNVQNGLLNLPLNLMQGINTVSISATNNIGTDSKWCSIKFAPSVVQNTVAVFPAPVITLVNPNLASSVSTQNIYNCVFDIQNITSVNNVTVKVNGTSFSILNYNPTSKQLTFSPMLSSGSNVIEVNATNQSGSDAKTVTIKYKPRNETVNAPNIVFTSPIASPFNTSTPNYTYKATLTNVNSVNELVVKYNNTVITNYTYFNSELIFNAPLIVGSNILDITATNAGGSIQSSAEVKYSVREIKKRPIITLIQPNTSTFITESYTNVLKIGVQNVNQQQDITIKVDGAAYTNFTYNNISKEVTINYNAHIGDNNFEFTATNAGGIDMKTLQLLYRKHVETPIVTETENPPVITLINPNTSLYITESYNILYVGIFIKTTRL